MPGRIGIMEFFVPLAEDAEQAEKVYRSIAAFVSAPIREHRIWKLEWRHKGEVMRCEVGGNLPDYYGTGGEPVLAIFDCGNLFKICTPSRGGRRGDPVLVAKNFESIPTLFSKVGDASV